MKKNTSSPPPCHHESEKDSKILQSYNLTILHCIGKMWKMKFNNNIYYNIYYY